MLPFFVDFKCPYIKSESEIRNVWSCPFALSVTREL